MQTNIHGLEGPMNVEIYIKSISLTQDYEALIYSRAHNACAPDLLRQMDQNLNGRALTPDSAMLLEIVAKLPIEYSQQVSFYDVGRPLGRVKALFSGVKQTPVVIMNGERYIGLQKAKACLALWGN